MLGIRFLNHVKLVVIAMGAVRHMAIVLIVAPLGEILRLTMATSSLLENSMVSAREEKMAITVLVLNLGRPILMVQRIAVRDS